MPAERGPSGTGHDTAPPGFKSIGRPAGPRVTEAAPVPGHAVKPECLAGEWTPRRVLNLCRAEEIAALCRVLNALPVAVPGPASERPHLLRLLWNREWPMLGLCLVGAVVLTLAAAGEGDT